jgi:hypothetical protein
MYCCPPPRRLPPYYPGGPKCRGIRGGISSAQPIALSSTGQFKSGVLSKLVSSVPIVNSLEMSPFVCCRHPAVPVPRSEACVPSVSDTVVADAGGSTVLPQHPTPQSLMIDLNSVFLRQLLRCQRRPKIGSPHSPIFFLTNPRTLRRNFSALLRFEALPAFPCCYPFPPTC